MNNQDLSNDAIIEALTLICEVDKYGAKFYRNKEGDFHRIHGPAMIWKDGEERWYKNGKLYRDDGPAVICSNGDKIYYINDMQLTLLEFCRWQEKNGITPIE